MNPEGELYRDMESVTVLVQDPEIITANRTLAVFLNTSDLDSASINFATGAVCQKLRVQQNAMIVRTTPYDWKPINPLGGIDLQGPLRRNRVPTVLERFRIKFLINHDMRILAEGVGAGKDDYETLFMQILRTGIKMNFERLFEDVEYFACFPDKSKRKLDLVDDFKNENY